MVWHLLPWAALPALLALPWFLPTVPLVLPALTVRTLFRGLMSSTDELNALLYRQMDLLPPVPSNSRISSIRGVLEGRKPSAYAIAMF